MFVGLGKIFSKSTSDQNLDLPMEALRLVTPMIGNQITQLSYELFHTIMASGRCGGQEVGSGSFDGERRVQLGQVSPLG
jgi:Na+-driven multidrug efflux pump